MLEHILRAVFPDQCIGCARWGSVLCHHCALQCPRYYGALPPLPVAQMAVRFVYTGHVRELILRLKYAGQRHIAVQLAQYMPAMFARRGVCYVAVPASPSRVAQRGYDQAILIAQALAMRHHGYVAPHLVRVRNTPTQAKLDWHARQINVKDAFVWRGSPVPAPVVLVDDVCTTGATLNAAIAALQRAGMSHVVVQVVARGIRDCQNEEPPVALQRGAGDD